jgi:hypothetical protein
MLVQPVACRNALRSNQVGQYQERARKQYRKRPVVDLPMTCIRHRCEHTFACRVSQVKD